MRIVVMFDLPVETAKNRRDYVVFRRFLIKSGFLMMQESIYCKLAQNAAAADNIAENVRKNKPAEGLVQMLKITEKQFSKMEYVVGEAQKQVLDSDERMVIL